MDVDNKEGHGGGRNGRRGGGAAARATGLRPLDRRGTAAMSTGGRTYHHLKRR
jgi:hypothetical protein